MTLQEIKQAIEEGKKVFWINSLYEVIKDRNNEYFIKSTSNNHCIGLTWSDGVTMNGDENDFYTF